MFLFLFAYLRFMLLLGCVFMFLVLFGAFLCFLVRVKSFRKKKINKKLKTVLMTSCILLLNFSYYKREFFNHYNLFITIFSLQSFSIMTVFFNYNIFFLVITIFQLLQFFNLFTTCDTTFMKISQRTNSII